MFKKLNLRLTSCQIVGVFFSPRPNPEDYIPPESDFHWAQAILAMLRLAKNLINHIFFSQTSQHSFCFLFLLTWS